MAADIARHVYGSRPTREGTKTMQDQTPNSQESVDPIGLLASEVLKDLYRALSGGEPAAVRSYRDEDAILLLLRFDPTELETSPDDGFAPFLDTAFLAMPGMVSSAVEARTGLRLAAGNLSVCPERGLAVFAFSALEEPAERQSDDDLFRIDAGKLTVAS
jgi:hypothetical protein